MDMETDSNEWTHGRHLLLQRCKHRALACMNEQEYSRAFAHFIIALTVEPAVKGELLNAFLFTVEKLVSKLEKEKQINEILMCYEQALDVLPHDSHILHGLATSLFRFGYVECALSYFLKSYQANPFFTPSLYCMENLKNALVERWHFLMLNDKKRNAAYERAIKKAVSEGCNHVLDIGAGTGILSMMAIDANAEKVYACEVSDIMFAVLQNVIKLNDKPIHAFQKLSTELKVPEDIPEKVSLIVTEIFDAGLFGEHCLETLNHAWENLLKGSDQDSSVQPQQEPAAEDASNSNSICSKDDCPSVPRLRVIPQSADVFVVPVECEQFRKFFRLENSVMQALDIKEEVSPQYLDEEPYSSDKLAFVDYKMLSTPVPLLHANFNSPEDIKTLLQGKVLNHSFKCSESGNLDAFVMWFELHLDDEETITTAPQNTEEGCCWDQAVFYVFPRNLNSSLPFCKVDDTIEAKFLCQEHFTLQKVKISNSPSKINSTQGITMDPSLIHLLNSYVCGNAINLNLKGISPVDNAVILDISTFPILSLKYLKDSSAVVSVLKTQYQAEIEQLRDMYGVQQDRLLFKSYEDFFNSKMQCDYLIVDPIEVCGLLKKNLIEDVTMLRMQCLKESGLVVPGDIEIHAVLVESMTLKEHSKVVSDDRVNGYKISQVMNAYQCQIHQDISFSKLPHKKLTKPFKVCAINLNDKSESGMKSFFNSVLKTGEVEVTSAGRGTAIVYWFTLKYNSSFVADTSSADGLWKQAACILNEEAEYQVGQKISFQYSLKNSCFQIGTCDPN